MKFSELKLVIQLRLSKQLTAKKKCIGGGDPKNLALIVLNQKSISKGDDCNGIS